MTPANKITRSVSQRLSLPWCLFIFPALLVALPPGCKRVPATPASLRELVARTEAADTKVLLVGIDGATFSVIDPLLATGELPAFQRLITNGARAPLRSLDPMISAALWNTIATGKRRAEHGIIDFRSRDPKTGRRTQNLVGSNDRKTLALWNIVGPFGKTAGIVAWWASWPAEPVNGWLLSDRMTRGRWSEWLTADRSGQLAFPNALAGELAPLIVDPEAPPLEEIAKLADFNSAELDELAAAKTALFAHGPSVSKFAYCAQRSYEKMALHQLAKGQPDLSAVYLIAADPISHTFWHFYEPSAFKPGGVDPQAAARLGKIIPNIYRHNDAYISELLGRVDPETVVFILSDHGFQADAHLPQERPGAELAEKFDERMQEAMRHKKVTIGQPGTHHRDGILIAAGGPIRKGTQTRASILDIAPTVLALMGLPVPEDMPGRVLTEIVEPVFWDAHPIARLDSYERLLPRRTLPAAGTMNDEEALQMLRALGYIP